MYSTVPTNPQQQQQPMSPSFAEEISHRRSMKDTKATSDVDVESQSIGTGTILVVDEKHGRTAAAGDVDDAMLFIMHEGSGMAGKEEGEGGERGGGVGGSPSATALTPEEDRRLLRKIDNIFMPLLLVTYTLSFMDKQAMAYSANFSLMEDEHIDTNQYSWASGSIVNIMILVSQPIVSRLMQVFPLARLLSTTVILWGVILMCTAATRSFSSLMACRTLLGLTESVISPAIVIMTGQWYKRNEQPARTGYWFIGNAIAVVFGGLIGYGVGHIHRDGVGSWIWYFIIFGALTVCWGVAMQFVLPDNPMKAKWLSREERINAVRRIQENRTGIINHKWKWSQFRECMLDPHVWGLFAINLLAAIPSGGVASFGSIVIRSFGFSTLNTTLLQMPLGLVQGISILVTGYLTQRFENIRCHIMALTQIPPLIGAVLLITLPQSNKGGRLAAYYIIQTHTVNYIMGFSMANANIAGFTKKATATAMMFIASSVGQISGPQLFKASQAPGYPMAFNAAVSCFTLLIVIPYLMQGYLMWENRRRARAEGNGAIHENVDEGLLDLTDHEQRGFRYVY